MPNTGVEDSIISKENLLWTSVKIINKSYKSGSQTKGNCCGYAFSLSLPQWLIGILLENN